MTGTEKNIRYTETLTYRGVRVTEVRGGVQQISLGCNDIAVLKQFNNTPATHAPIILTTLKLHGSRLTQQRRVVTVELVVLVVPFVPILGCRHHVWQYIIYIGTHIHDIIIYYFIIACGCVSTGIYCCYIILCFAYCYAPKSEEQSEETQRANLLYYYLLSYCRIAAIVV